MEQGMEESDIEGLATHGGPESCAGSREGVGEALAGGVQAGLWTREINIKGAPTRSRTWKATSRTALERVVQGLPAVGEPRHVHKLHAREPGGPAVACSVI